MAGLRRRTDRMFAVLLFLQWLGGIALASWYSPGRTAGRLSTLNVELMTAIFLGGAIIALPLFLIFRKPGLTVTREVVSATQMLSSGLLVHLSGGHNEMHFHIFGSLAFLAFYRDWKVLAIASAVVSADYFRARRVLAAVGLRHHAWSRPGAGSKTPAGCSLKTFS